MPVVDVGGSQMDVISRLLKDRILLLGQQVTLPLPTRGKGDTC